MNQQTSEGARLVPVIINGKPYKIDANSIPKENRHVFHGEYKGTKVNSPGGALVGDSFVFWFDIAEPHSAEAMPKAEFGMLAKGFLKLDDETA